MDEGRHKSVGQIVDTRAEQRKARFIQFDPGRGEVALPMNQGRRSWEALQTICASVRSWISERTRASMVFESRRRARSEHARNRRRGTPPRAITDKWLAANAHLERPSATSKRAQDFAHASARGLAACPAASLESAGHCARRTVRCKDASPPPPSLSIVARCHEGHRAARGSLQISWRRPHCRPRRGRPIPPSRSGDVARSSRRRATPFSGARALRFRRRRWPSAAPRSRPWPNRGSARRRPAQPAQGFD
jgi:hypothetical protein